MTTSTTVRVAGRDITVPEMTGMQARNKLRELELASGSGKDFTDPNYWDDWLSVDGLSFTDLKKFSDITDADLDHATQPELAALVVRIKASNVLFFDAQNKFLDAVNSLKRDPSLLTPLSPAPTSSASSLQ